MTFKDKLQEFQNARSNVAMTAVVERAAEQAACEVKLQSLIGQLNPLVEPILKKFCHDANESGYASNYHFNKDGWFRCWWVVTLVPAPGEEPESNDLSRRSNEASALVRLHNNGEMVLEWHTPSTFNYSHGLTTDQLRRKEKPEYITATALEGWLDAFTEAMLTLRARGK